MLVILPLITAPYISRTLGATAVGVYSYTYSVAYYFLLIAMLGIGNHGNRSIAAVRDDRKKLNKTFSSIYSLHSAGAFVMDQQGVAGGISVKAPVGVEIALHVALAL